MIVFELVMMLGGLLLMLLPRSIFELEGIGYVKPLRVMAVIIGGLFFVFGVALAVVQAYRR